MALVCDAPVCCSGFFVFACATLGVLMVMETLSAFLHALRYFFVSTLVVTPRHKTARFLRLKGGIQSRLVLLRSPIVR